MREAYKVLKEYFGYDNFRPGQEKIIKAILAMKDCLGIMPTGAGKSICYEVPALVFCGITIVISPLISLMDDQIKQLKESNISSIALNSSLTFLEYKAALKEILLNKYRFVYLAPERLTNNLFSSVCQELNISLLVIDEAHCISQWGQDFRPAYLKITEFIRGLKKRPVIAAFTATATRVVREDIMSVLQLNMPEVVITGYNRSNLYFEIKKNINKEKFIFSYLTENKDKSGVIYAGTRNSVEVLTKKLKELGYSVCKYHAGLSLEERKNNQKKFVSDEIKVIVATNAFGMGINKANVNFVIHYNMPKDLESYYQEAGRAGRDGTCAKCIILYSDSDYALGAFFINKNYKESKFAIEYKKNIRESQINKLKIIRDYCLTTICLRYFVLSYFGEESKTFCGYCSNCQKTTGEIDITKEAMIILKCLNSLEINFTLRLLEDFLRGRKSKEIKVLKLAEVFPFGKLKAVKINKLKLFINFLFYKNYIFRSERNAFIYLSSSGKEALLNKEIFRMEVSKKNNRLIVRKYLLNEALVYRLKNLRFQLSLKKGIPSSMIFSDSTLERIAKKLPKDFYEFSRIKTVDKNKIKEYGRLFLNEVRSYLGLDLKEDYYFAEEKSFFCKLIEKVWKRK